MWFRLATAWGCTIREAQARCDSREFSEWLAFDELEPSGKHLDDLRWGVLLSMFFNANKSRNTPKKKPKDFMFGDTTPRKLSVAEIKAKFMAALGPRKK